MNQEKQESRPLRVVFWVPYPLGKAPSQRFRFEQYFFLLKENGIEFDVQSFIDEATWEILYKKGHFLKKIFGIFRGFLRRWVSLFRMGKYDLVFLHREAAPLGPPVFEWILAKILKKRFVYDFDDAIWLPNVSGSNRLFSKIKCFGKVSVICRLAWKISAGNDFLADYGRQYNSRVFVNPTTIDTSGWHNRIKDQKTERFVLGWTGSHSTVEYLKLLEQTLKEIASTRDYDFVVISDREPELDLPNLRFIPWNKETEIEDLLLLNAGVMPLKDDPWSRGKCGFKALQYMSLGIPAIVSPVGVNRKIVDHGINGFICETEYQWKQAIEILIDQPELRPKMGAAAREKIEKNYSVKANSSLFLSLIASV